MPREGIDYPGWFNRAACSIRCELSKLWSAVGAKVAKLNTVEPDGDGKVKIVSDSATLTVTDDPSNNAVRLELDAGLSSPPVQSVNGATGTVVLDGSNITTDYRDYVGILTMDTVEDALTGIAADAKAADNALRTRMTAAETAISTEASDRATADNALATQIATKAGIGDTVVKNPVAAQSIAGYDLEIQEDLDVDGDLTVGGTTDTAVATGTTGTYNTKAANSQRIKNELDAYGPMVRSTGTMNPITGLKSYIDISTIFHMNKISNAYLNWISIPATDGNYYLTMIATNRNNFAINTCTFTISGGTVTNVSTTNLLRNGTNTTIKFGVFTDNGIARICMHFDATNQYCTPILLGIHGDYGNPPSSITTPIQTISTVGGDYQEVTL